MWIWLLAATLAGAPSAPATRKLTAAEVKEVAAQVKVSPEQIADGQAFEVAGLGKATRFAAVLAPEAADYYLLREGKIVSRVSTQNTQSYAFPTGLTAVAFEDVTGSGLWDILAIEHHSGTGPVLNDGSRAQLDYDAPVLLVQRADGTFTDQSARLNWACSKGRKQPNPLTVRDLRKAATCVSALSH
jgi:hypothetical protein